MYFKLLHDTTHEIAQPGKKKILKALDYNSAPSILEEIMETIKIIEQEIARRENKYNSINHQVA